MHKYWNLSAIVKNLLIGAVLFLLSLAIYTCKNPEIASDYYAIHPVAVHENGNAFAGSTTCIPCHKDIYATHVNTAHYNTSALAAPSNIKGSFKTGENTFVLNNRVLFTLTETDSGFYQRANFIHNQLELFNLPIDIVFGSGTKGQSYLSWKADELFQLQASYFKPANRWTSSPGLKNMGALRPVSARCFECHGTFAKNIGTAKKGNQYDKKEIIYGIDCERCHGPSAKHVGYHQKNPNTTISKYIINHKKLSRQQRLDACALCHSGAGKQAKEPPFSFLVGDDLEKFYRPIKKEVDTTLDVHSNQYGLLARSACFKNSPTMDCMTCHDPHKNERGDAGSFNLKCMGCHAPADISCKEDDENMDIGMNNCITCHMPLKPSKAMVITLDSSEIAVKVRTHLIDVYLDRLSPKP